MTPSTSQGPGATADLQQEVVLQDALNRFQQEALERQGVTELGLTLLQPQSGWWGLRQLPEQGQGAGGGGEAQHKSVVAGAPAGRAGRSWLVARVPDDQVRAGKEVSDYQVWQGLPLGSG